MTNKTAALTFGLIIILLTGCAGLQSDYETPSFIINNFRALSSEGIAPQFEIGLHIINPNRKALELAGISYSVELEGHKILTGVSNKLPVVDAYGESDVTLVATAGLFNSISLLADLMREQRSSFKYVLNVKMDIVGLRRNIHSRKEGTISLAPDR